MAVIYGAPSSLYTRSIGTAIGMPVQNALPINIIAIGSAKDPVFDPFGTDMVADDGGPGLGAEWMTTRLSNTAMELQIGDIAQGQDPGTLNHYLDGKGIVTGIEGRIRDAISSNQSNPTAAVYGDANSVIKIHGVAFYEAVMAGEGGICNVLAGHGISGIIDYFIDYRKSGYVGEPVMTLITLGANLLTCSLVGVSFRASSDGGEGGLNAWRWMLEFTPDPELQEDIDVN